MKILVTGGAGYIGSILIEYLLHKDYSVTVLDNFSYESNTLASYCNNKNFELIKEPGPVYASLETIKSAFLSSGFTTVLICNLYFFAKS